MCDVVGLRRVPCHLQIPRGRGVGGWVVGVCVRLLVGGGLGGGDKVWSVGGGGC